MAQTNLLLSSLAVLLLQAIFTSAALPKDYQKKSALEKQTILWEKIIQEPYAEDALPTAAHDAAYSAKNLVDSLFHTVSFNHVSDEMPEGRLKLFHSYGSCAKATLEISPDSMYTGIFKAGAKSHTILRSSVQAWSATRMMPSAALKVFIDSKPSQNIVTVFDLDGTYEYMTHVVSNFFPSDDEPLTGANLVGRAMALALRLLPGFIADRPVGSNNMPVYEPAAMENNGRTVAKGGVVAPWKIDFEPNADFANQPDTTADFRIQIADIPAGSTMYNIKVYRTEAAWNNKEGDLIGKVVLDTPLLATKYCDEGFFIQHARKAHQMT